MSIRARLLLLVLLAVVPLVALSAARFISDRNASIALAERDLRTTAQNIADGVGREIQGTTQLLYGMARSPAISDPARCADFMRSVAGEYPRFTNLLAADPDGNIYCDATNAGRVNIGDRPYFERALLLASAAAAEPVFSRLSNQPVVTVAFPVWSAERGAVNSVLIAGIDLAWIARNVIGLGSAPEAEVLLARPDGQIMVWLPEEQHAAEWGRPIADTDLLQHAQHGGDGTFVTRIGGVGRIWTVSEASGITDGGLRVMVGAPEKSLLAMANGRLRLDLAVLSAMVLLLFGSATALAEGGIRRPVRRIHETAQRLIHGDLSARIVGPVPFGELGELMAALNQAAASFTALIESSPAAMIGVDAQGHVTLWNRAAQSLFGLSPGEIRGQPLARLGHSAGPMVQASARALAGETVELPDFTWQRDDGKGKGVRIAVRAGALRHGDAQPYGAILIVSDVTERTALEGQLRQAQKLETLGQLTGGIAHDFNNLLTAIIGNTQMVADRAGADAELRELAESTVLAARHGADLTRNLLAFAKRQPLQPRPVNLVQTLRGMAGLLRRTLGAHIDCKFEFGESVWPALADVGQFESAVLNLALNARDAMTDGGRLTIAVRNAHLHGPRLTGEFVQVSVNDTGHGMSPATLERILEPFFTTKPVGSGLGVPMVYGFARQSGGDLIILSELGRGTTVNLLLPKGGEGVADVIEEAVPPQRGKGEHILVVEDDDRVRPYVVKELTTLGYRVTAAIDGGEALEVLASGEKIDLLFTDVMMPGGVTGVQLAERAQQRRPELRVLLTTGQAGMLRSSRLVLPVLAKPYLRAELAAALRSVLDA